MRPIVKIKRAVANAEPSDDSGIFAALAVWNNQLTEVLDEKGGEEYRDLFWECVEDVTDLVIHGAFESSSEWDYLTELIEAYPVEESHHAHTPIVNAVGAATLKTRFETDINDVPVSMFDYLISVGSEHPSSTSWEDAFAAAWFIDHSDIDSVERFADVIPEEEDWVMGVLGQAWHVDQERAFELTKIGIESNESVETFMWLETAERVYHPKSIRAPRYHSPPQHYSLPDRIDPGIADRLLDYIIENDYIEGVEHYNILPQIR